MDVIDTAMDRRLGRGRVDFRTNVRLVADDQERIVVAQTANLSETGMFVVSQDLYEVGTQLFCSLFHRPLGLAVTGRVTRIASGHSTGMGIEFVDLSDNDLHQLRQLIEKEQPKTWFRPVRLYLEEVELPIQGQATQMANELVISSYLRFLRRGAKATILPKDARGTGYRGTLSNVTLNASRVRPFPMLSLHFKLDPITAEGIDAPDVNEGLAAPTQQEQTDSEPDTPARSLKLLKWILVVLLALSALALASGAFLDL